MASDQAVLVVESDLSKGQNGQVSEPENTEGGVEQQTLLHCPIRGKLTASALAKDGLTPSEEARRIEFLKYLLSRKYPKTHIAVETVILKKIGNSGRNKLRCDVIVYSIPASDLANLPFEKRLQNASLVAEIKRDSANKASAISSQLEPAMRQLPGMNVLGVYWDDVSRILFTKKLVGKGSSATVHIEQDTIANLPQYGRTYSRKPITVEKLASAENLVGTLMGIANIMRSHGVNDEHLRYKETVKLLLARYCDEKQALSSSSKELALQVFPGPDPAFKARLDKLYKTSAKRYSNAKTLFHPIPGSELDERTLRDIVKTIQGINFSSASNEMMQQVFQSFVPAVFKKSLDQYFTPSTLIEAIVAMVKIGPTDKIADPAMGTADFLTASMQYRSSMGDSDIIQRIFGCDSDRKAYDLAVVNMILNKDGQSNLRQADSIADWTLWNDTIDVVLCNPPFGARSLESRQQVLKQYDLGHEWLFDSNTKKWVKSDHTLPSQQLGILFIERSFKMLAESGRLGIILPEGYLCTSSYGYVRQWILNSMRILSLVELPRRIFTKSEADLRSNILIAQKLNAAQLDRARRFDYPIHTELVRKVGFKMGAGFSPVVARDPETGLEVRDGQNKPVLDTDFNRVKSGFDKFTSESKWQNERPPRVNEWPGAKLSDITSHSGLDMKPRRLMPKALGNLQVIKQGEHVKLETIADVITTTMNLQGKDHAKKLWRLIEGLDIRAVEGTVLPQHPQRAWEIAERKSADVIGVKDGDIIIGLVRPERRNIGMLLDTGKDVVASPDGVSVVRIKPEFSEKYPQEWLFAALRSEQCRLQFWTESGGTSYGKLTPSHIANVLLPTPKPEEVSSTASTMKQWASSMRSAVKNWETIGSEEDRRIIRNSAIYGLESTESDE